MAGDENIDHLPLKERLKKAQYLSRELSEHITQAYLPRLGDLRLVTKEFDAKKASDQRVFDCTVAVLDAEEFTEKIYAKLTLYLESIRTEMFGMLFSDHKNDSSSAIERASLEIDGLELFD